MIKLLNKEKVGEIIGNGVLKIVAIEGCCGYVLKTSVSDDGEANIGVEGLKFSIDEETEKIAPRMSIDVDDVNTNVLIVKNLSAKSYCGCGRSFSI
ncbi:hypothetical protein KBB41_02725 [Candidatus Curtissbacteria bacterium]|nr:hypothetical protein [Candidatus Curtissbacteria bacterium]